ncbi:integrase core domain-containing protein [Cesiribacter sp. SM1]|uniref:integrase core domain-containing protein n=1 Tax=Cesiribacter sp. SM1 TaxID=2861196 RepID=UPI00351D8894
MKFRPIKPRSPHLNGKVERSQQTDKAEFYSLLDKKDPQLDWQQASAQWENFYNQERLHSSLHGKTPWEKYLEVKAIIPTQEQIQHQYQQKKETVHARNNYFFQWQKKIIWLNSLGLRHLRPHLSLDYKTPQQVQHEETLIFTRLGSQVIS